MKSKKFLPHHNQAKKAYPGIKLIMPAVILSCVILTDGLVSAIPIDPPEPIFRCLVRGRVTNSAGVGLSNVTIAISDGCSGSVQTDANGNYQFSAISDESYAYTVTPSKNRYRFNPASINLSASRSTYSIANFVGTLLSNRPGDFDGNGTTDISVWRPNNGSWYVLNNPPSGFYGVPFGTLGDKIVPGDYDGDGKTDFAVFRLINNQGNWYISQSSNSQFKSVVWGLSNDIPVPRDYDGDGKTDFAVFRPSNGAWYILQSSDTQVRTQQTLATTGDIPVPGDYDGDGKADVAVFRPSTGNWQILKSSNNQSINVIWGQNGDKPVQEDYDGDGKTDVALFRPSNGTWYIINSSNNQQRFQQWGLGTDIPVPGYYDNDGKADIAVFRQGTWYLLQSSNGQKVVSFGQSKDIPVPSGYFSK
ncbi:FG-GAP-like repeat-containing protein [Nostoc sp. CHAB 5844]|nr:FG-GAP-like repeat-containing protein [Nostoc sp. CHAB 5844]